MGESARPTGKITQAASAERITSPVSRGKEALSPKKALRGPVGKALKLPGLKKLMNAFALVKLLRFVRLILGSLGFRVVAIVALVLGGWAFRRFRKR
jgi:hypothetical protein